MDRISSAVIEKICSLASLGRYVVFSEDELFEAFPDGAERTEGELKNALKTLLNAGYIDIKYSGGSLYCIAPVRKYEPEPEPPATPSPQPESRKKAGFKWFIPFIAAFAGGAAGSFIVSLAFALI